MDFSNKIILVTGAARGIGRAIAQAFAQRGGTVAVHYRASGAEAQALARALPGQAHAAFRADVSDPVACEKLVAEVTARYSRLDVLVNNAGIYEVRPLKNLSYTD